jgi:hypothetical protein
MLGALAAGLLAPAVGRERVPRSLSVAAAELRQHVLRVADNGRLPFAVIDKRRAHLWLFDARGRPVGDSPVLLGWARGDDAVPGIGARAVAKVRPHERTTPAGRFVTERGRNLRGEDVLWVDYDTAISMHRVVTHSPIERRVQRLSTTSAADNRISFGCINLPTDFFGATLQPLAARATPIVYVLPETRPWQSIFAASSTRPH